LLSRSRGGHWPTDPASNPKLLEGANSSPQGKDKGRIFLNSFLAKEFLFIKIKYMKIDINQFKTVGEWFSFCRSMHLPVPVQAPMQISRVIKEHKCSFQQAYQTMSGFVRRYFVKSPPCNGGFFVGKL